MSPMPAHGQHGFTLIEIAIVVFILGLVLAGLIGPIESQIEARDRKQTDASLAEVLEALYGFAIGNGRLPCPDADGDGDEDFAAGPPPFACAQSENWLPWATLATAAGDAWGNRFRYRVDEPAFTTRDDGLCGGIDLDLCREGSITVATRGDDAATAAPAIEGKFGFTAANKVPAVVLSHGRNGFGATSVQGVPRAAPPVNTDEAENADGDGSFTSRTYSRGGDGCADDGNEATVLCAFDDLVAWISPPILHHRLVLAGRLP